MKDSMCLGSSGLQDIVEHNPVVLQLDTSVTDAVAAMEQAGSNYVLVVTTAEQLVGIVTAHDILRTAIQPVSLERLPIQAVMSSPVISLPAAVLADPGQVLSFFQDHNLPYLPLLDAASRCVGVILRKLVAQQLLPLGITAVTFAEQYKSHLTIQAISELLEDRHSELEEMNYELQVTLEELHSAEEDLRRRNMQLECERLKYQDLFNFAPDGYLVTNATGVIQSANQAIGQLLAINQDFLLGKSLLVFVNSDDYGLYYKLLDAHPQAMKQMAEITWQPRHGQPFPAEVTVAPIYDEAKNDHLMGWRWLIHDISDRRQAAQALQQLNQELEQRVEERTAELMNATRLKDEFLANMSHELRTPLNAILGLSETLLDEIMGSINDQQKKALETIEQSGDHLLSLINDVLDVSKIAAGKLELQISTVSIADLCASSLAFVRPQVRKKQIEITTVLDPNLATIDLDERRFRQVLINLLTNAVKFTPEAGRVTLQVRADAAGYYFAVIDTGIGISPSNQAKLFQPFMQVDASLNRQYEGSGLGLILVKQIVELHGGSVSLTSELGQGSCFSIFLPTRCPGTSHNFDHIH